MTAILSPRWLLALFELRPGTYRPVRRDLLVIRGLLGGLAVVLLHVHFAHRRRPGRGAAKGLEAMLGAVVRGGDALVRKMGARAQRLDAHLATSRSCVARRAWGGR